MLGGGDIDIAWAQNCGQLVVRKAGRAIEG